MNEPKLFQEPELTQAEEGEALMLFVNDDDTSGRWRWKRIRGFFESLHRRNPLEVVWDKTTLYAPSQPVRDTDFSETYNLDIRQGANRHSFADSYTHFIFRFTWDTSSPADRSIFSFFIDSDSILNAPQTSPHGFGVNISNVISNFAFQSNTSFRLAGTDHAGANTGGALLAEIVGVKQIIRPSSL